MLFYSYLATLDGEERSRAEEIFENYYKLVYEISYKILNNHQDAEDTVDEVMINVIKNIDRFLYADRNAVEAQLVIYSRNAAINLYKKNKYRREHTLPFTFLNEEEEFEDIDIEDPGDSMEDIILSKETVEVVTKHLMNLPIEYRDAIELVYGMGYTNVEAARILHITPNAIGLRLYKAKKKLLKMAGGELHERI